MPKTAKAQIHAMLKESRDLRLERRAKIAGVLRGAAALVSAGTAAGAYGLDKLSAEDLKRVKLAARIINADVGLEAIIAHIKAAKAKSKAAA